MAENVYHRNYFWNPIHQFYDPQKVCSNVTIAVGLDVRESSDTRESSFVAIFWSLIAIKRPKNSNKIKGSPHDGDLSCRVCEKKAAYVACV